MQMVTRLMRHFIFTLIALLAVPIAAQETTAQAQTPAEGEQPAKQEASEIEKASASGEQVVVDKELFEKGYYEREVFNYQNHIKDYQKELRALINKNLDEKKRSIEGKYATAIEREELREAQSRIDAIALFETFLSKYPKTRNTRPARYTDWQSCTTKIRCSNTTAERLITSAIWSASKTMKSMSSRLCLRSIFQDRSIFTTNLSENSRIIPISAGLTAMPPAITTTTFRTSTYIIR